MLVSELNIPLSPGLELWTQVGIWVQESWATVTFHKQVDVFLGLVEAGQARRRQGLLDLFSNMMVDVDLKKNQATR